MNRSKATKIVAKSKIAQYQYQTTKIAQYRNKKYPLIGFLQPIRGYFLFQHPKQPGRYS